MFQKTIIHRSNTNPPLSLPLTSLVHLEKMNQIQRKILTESDEQTRVTGNSIESLTLRNFTSPAESTSRTQDLGRDETGLYPARRFGMRYGTLEKIR